MATWEAPLPGEAVIGEAGHTAAHNELVAAIVEARAVLDAVEASIPVVPAPVTWGTLGGKPTEFPPAAHNQGANTISVTAISGLSGTTVQLALADLQSQIAAMSATILDQGARIAALEAAAPTE